MPEIYDRLRSLELSRAATDDHEDRLKSLENQLAQLTVVMQNVAREVSANTDLTRDIKNVLVTAKVMTAMIKWSAAVGIGTAALWASLKHLAEIKLWT